MTRIEWDGSLETGFEAVDSQHQTIIRLFNQFEACLDDGREASVVEALIVGLCEYVAIHFADEEELMQRFGYPEAAAADHIAEHRSLAQRTRELALVHRAGEDSGRSLATLLREWLIDHIMRVDRRLIGHVRVVLAAEGDQPEPLR